MFVVVDELAEAVFVGAVVVVETEPSAFVVMVVTEPSALVSVIVLGCDDAEDGALPLPEPVAEANPVPLSPPP